MLHLDSDGLAVPHARMLGLPGPELAIYLASQVRFYRQAAAACKRMGYPRRAREDESRARAAEAQIRRIADNLMQA